MTVRLYLSNSAAALTPTVRGTWTSTASTHLVRDLGVREGAGTIVQATDSVTTNPNNMRLGTFVGPALVESGPLSGSITYATAAVENSTAANATLRGHGYVLTPSNTVRGTFMANTSLSSEFATGAYTTIIQSRAITTVNCVAGDRVVVELGASFANSVSTGYAAAFVIGYTALDIEEHNVTLTTPNLCPWIDFPSDTLFPGSPASSMLNFF